MKNIKNKELLEFIEKNNKVMLVKEVNTKDKVGFVKEICQNLDLKSVNLGMILDEYVAVKGYMSPEGKYVASPLYNCYKNGYACIIENIDYTDEKHLEEFKKIIGKDGYLPYEFANGETVTPHPNFRLFVTTSIPDSLMDRFAVIDFSNQEKQRVK